MNKPRRNPDGPPPLPFIAATILEITQTTMVVYCEIFEFLKNFVWKVLQRFTAALSCFYTTESYVKLPISRQRLLEKTKIYFIHTVVENATSFLPMFWQHLINFAKMFHLNKEAIRISVHEHQNSSAQKISCNCTQCTLPLSWSRYSIFYLRFLHSRWLSAVRDNA